MSGPPRQRSGTALFFALLALILLAIPFAYWFFLRGGVAPPVRPSVAVQAAGALAPKPVELHLGEVEGTVEIRQPDGSWRFAAKGDPLKNSDAVRTLDGSVAVLVGGEAWEVRMEPGTQISVEDLTASISRILLANGMATARVKGDARHTFEVRAAGSDAVATTSSGTFAISNNGAGTVAVGTREGEVQLAGGAKVVIVRAGQNSIVRPGEGPSTPTEIPSSLLLKVKWPDKPLLRNRRLVVSGQTAPGAHVEVSGRVIRADADGRFSARVPLAEGNNRVEVRATSVGGVKAASDAKLQVDTRPPKMGIDRNLWK